MAKGREPTRRLEIRTSAELHDGLTRAARLKGVTVNAYVQSALDQAVARDLLEITLVRMSKQASLRFVEAFLQQEEEPTRTNEFEKAIARYRYEVDEE